MKKTLLFYNETAALKQLTELGKARDEFQEVIDEFCQLAGSKSKLKLEELKSFVRSGFNQVEAKPKEINIALAKKHLPSGKLGGLKVNFETIDKFLELPPIDEVIRLIEAMSLSSLPWLTPENFKLDNNTLSVLEGVEDRIRESHKLYIDNELEAERFGVALELCEALNKLYPMLPKAGPGQLETVGDLAMIALWSHEKNMFEVNVDFVKFGRAGSYVTGADMARMNIEAAKNAASGSKEKGSGTISEERMEELEKLPPEEKKPGATKEDVDDFVNNVN